jgi:hypothetical protein
MFKKDEIPTELTSTTAGERKNGSVSQNLFLPLHNFDRKEPTNIQTTSFAHVQKKKHQKFRQDESIVKTNTY